MIRIYLPHHLQQLAGSNREVELQFESEPVSLAAVLDELENKYPTLRGTIRDQENQQRRPYIRFFACGEDLSHLPLDTQLPHSVITGAEPLRIVGAMAGG